MTRFKQVWSSTLKIRAESAFVLNGDALCVNYHCYKKLLPTVTSSVPGSSLTLIRSSSKIEFFFFYIWNITPESILLLLNIRSHLFLFLSFVARFKTRKRIYVCTIWRWNLLKFSKTERTAAACTVLSTILARDLPLPSPHSSGNFRWVIESEFQISHS